MRVQRSRSNDGPSPRVPAVTADMLAEYSEGLRQTMDRIGVVTRQEEEDH